MAGYRAVLLNDTANNAHHGCRSVIQSIHTALSHHGIAITASTPAGANWEADKPFLEMLSQANIIIINGEGTLHHGAPAGEALLRIVDHPLSQGRPKVLINALWQDNPSEWISWLKRFDLVSVRDGRSRRALLEYGVEAHFCPDLSFYTHNSRAPLMRDPTRYVFGDSVYMAASKDMLTAYANHRGPKTYLPVRARLRHSPAFGPLRFGDRIDNLRHSLRASAHRMLDRDRFMARDADEYVSILAQSGFHITGRYHAVCLSIASRTPFTAVTSNSHKTEALIDDVGLNTQRLTQTVDEAMRRGMMPFSEEEEARIGRWLDLSGRRTDQIFNEIAGLIVR